MRTSQYDDRSWTSSREPWDAERSAARVAVGKARRRLREAKQALVAAGALSAEQQTRFDRFLSRGRDVRLWPSPRIWSLAKDLEAEAVKAGTLLARVTPPAQASRRLTVSTKASLPIRRGPRALRLQELPSARQADDLLQAPSSPSVLGPRNLGLDAYLDRPGRLEELGRRQLVELMTDGYSASAALKHLGAAPTAKAIRQAQRLLQRFRADGRVDDQRWRQPPRQHVMTPAVQAAVLKFWQGRRGANIHLVHQKAVDMLKAQNLSLPPGRQHPIPSYRSVHAFTKRVPQALRVVREAGMDTWDQNHRLFVGYAPDEYANHIWQIDHTTLDLWVRATDPKGVEVATRPFMTAVMDAYSRCVMAFVLSVKEPDAWTTALVLRKAIAGRPGDIAWPMHGVPDILVPDRGSDFMSSDVARLVQGLGIQLRPCPPRYPNMKAEIESWFRTLNLEMAGLAGAAADGRSEGSGHRRLEGLYDLPQAREEIDRFVCAYHARRHSALKVSPLQRWMETAVVRTIPDEELRVLTLKESRLLRVTKLGISFTHQGVGGQYVAAELLDLMGDEVWLRFNPEDMASVLVYRARTDEFVCEAWLVGGADARVTVADVKRWRTQFRRGLVERTMDYHRALEREDRQSAAARKAAVAAIRAEERGRKMATDPLQAEQERLLRLWEVDGASSDPASGAGPRD